MQTIRPRGMPPDFNFEHDLFSNGEVVVEAPDIDLGQSASHFLDRSDIGAALASRRTTIKIKKNK